VSESDGQVSEVANLGDNDPIQPDQSVAGKPDEDGVQEGRQGPNARSGARAEEHRNEDYTNDGEARDPQVDRDLQA
jgi:hypothetical protein